MEYDFEHFAHAWKDSKCFMMATDEPAPFQYNAETGCMELSNFATEFSIQEFPFHNEFTDIWQVDELGYVPYYTDGHLLNITDDLSYEEFIFAYDNDRFESLDDSLNIYDNQENCIQIDFGDEDVVTDVMPIENLFDYGIGTDDNLIYENEFDY